MQQELPYNCILVHDKVRQPISNRNKCLSTSTFNSDNFPNNTINLKKWRLLSINLDLINSLNL